MFPSVFEGMWSEAGSDSASSEDTESVLTVSVSSSAYAGYEKTCKDKIQKARTDTQIRKDFDFLTVPCSIIMSHILRCDGKNVNDEEYAVFREHNRLGGDHAA